jgi:hypothetical protein
MMWLVYTYTTIIKFEIQFLHNFVKLSGLYLKVNPVQTPSAGVL